MKQTFLVLYAKFYIFIIKFYLLEYIINNEKVFVILNKLVLEN